MRGSRSGFFGVLDEDIRNTVSFNHTWLHRLCGQRRDLAANWLARPIESWLKPSLFRAAALSGSEKRFREGLENCGGQGLRMPAAASNDRSSNDGLRTGIIISQPAAYQ